MMGAAAIRKRGVPLEIADFLHSFVHSTPAPAAADVSFVSTPAAADVSFQGNARARFSPDSLDCYPISPPSPRAKRAPATRVREVDGLGAAWGGDYSESSDRKLRWEIETMTDSELERQTADLHPSFGGLRGERSKRVLPMLQEEARRRGILTGPAKDGGGGCNQAARSRDVFTFGIEDALTEDDSRFQKPSTIHPTNKKYGPLGVQTRRSSRQNGQMKPIPVDKMYPSTTSPTSFCGHTQRVRANDPKEHDNAKSRHAYRDYAKRRKEHHEDISLLHQKLNGVVLLDDEDVQPDEPVDDGLLEKWKDLKIYYPPSDDPEAVELSSSDIRCLNPGVYLSSPVINYYIQYIKRAEMHVEYGTDKFHMFNTYFYGKLQEALLDKVKFLKLRRWWKGVNIFQRGYLILPIHGMSHWSLIIVCMPAKESNSGPIILHLDSLGMHPSNDLFDTVGRYLEEEWRHLRKNASSDILTSDTIWQDFPRNMEKVKLEVPAQNNAYDCGIFMLFYIQRFIGQAPERFTRESIPMFGRSWFKSEATSSLRSKIRGQLLELFENSRVDDVMPEAAAPDGSDELCIIKEGETEAAVRPCISSGMVVGGGDVSTCDKEDFMEGRAWGGTPSTTCRSDGMIRDCALSEAAMLSDTMEGDGTMKTDCGSSKTEQETEILPPDRPKHNEVVVNIQSTPDPTLYCSDSCDSDVEEVKTPEVEKRRHIMKTDCGSSKTEQEAEILPPDRPKHSEEVVINLSTPDPPLYCSDSCDSDVEEVKTLGVEKRRRRRSKWVCNIS